MTLILDPGHGGFIGGIYQTFPEKMYQHSNSEVFYEGVFNRIIKDMLIRALWEKGVKVIDLCPSELDIPLDVRVNVANTYYKEYPNAVLLSLHSNAGGGTGFEVWTSPGQTKSDKYAEVLAHEIMAKFAMPFRSDTSDGDHDKEAAFYILQETVCPAVLVECLFFDNYNDYLKLEDKVFRKRYVDALVNFVLKAELVL